MIEEMKNNTMGMDLKEAVQILLEKGHTCVLVKGNIRYTSDQRGVKPLLEWIEAGMNLSGFSVADKVVGKGAAMLYVLLQVHAVYAPVMSESAYEVLKKYGIEVFVEDSLVKRIRNRTDTGFCPIEECVLDMEDVSMAYEAIKERVSKL